jgi:hypothetical protein
MEIKLAINTSEKEILRFHQQQQQQQQVLATFSGQATEVKKNTQGRLQVQCAAAMENAGPLLPFPFFFLCAVAESP